MKAKIRYIIASIILFAIPFVYEIIYNKVTNLADKNFDVTTKYTVIIILSVVLGIILPLHFHFLQNLKFNKLFILVPLILTIESVIMIISFTGMVGPCISAFMAVYTINETVTICIKQKA